MRVSEVLKSSLATLRLNGRRTFLTMIGIIIGISAVITIMSLGNGFQQQTLNDLAKDAQGRANQSFYFYPTSEAIDYSRFNPFTQADLAAIGNLPGVAEVKVQEEQPEKVIYMDTAYSNQKEAYDVSLVASSQYKMVSGRNLSLADFQNRQRYAIIDQAAATALFKRPGLALHQSIQLDKLDYTIIGVYDSQSAVQEAPVTSNSGVVNLTMSQIEIPYSTYERFNPQDSYEWEIIVYFEPDTNMKLINQAIYNYLLTQGSAYDLGDYRYFDSSEMMEQIGSTLNMITLFVSAIASISLFIAGVGVMNMMYISVSERTKEIGIRRSLGATRQSITWQFLLEGIAITALGGVVGYLLGIGLAFVISGFLPFSAIIDLQTALVSVSVSVVIGLAFSVFPARTAANKNVVDILR